MKDKPVIEAEDSYLSRDLTEFDITMIGVGAMIGAGIFVLTGIAAGTAGPGLLLAFALNGIVTIFTAMVYAELGSAIPESGGGYLWVKEAFGGSQGFLAGWMSWFSHAVAGALYALGFGSYGALLLKDLGVPLHHLGLAQGWIEKGLAVLVVLLFLAIHYRGTSETGMTGNIVTLGKLAVIGVFIAGGLWRIFTRPAPLAHFAPFFPTGVGSVFVAMGFTFIAFEGYEIIVQAGEEVKNPRRSIPRAIFWALIVVVPIYVLVGFAALGAVDSAGPTWQYLGQFKELGLVKAAGQFLPYGTYLLLLGGLLSTVSALNATTFSSTRVAFAMGRDRSLPDFFARIHAGNRTPYLALFGTGAIILAMVAFIPIEDVATAADVMFLLLFIQVNGAVLKIRREFGERLHYGYLLPFYPAVPVIGGLLQAALAIYLYRFSPKAWYLAGGWIVVGAGLYLAYARGRLQAKEESRIARVRQMERVPGTRGPEVLVAVAKGAEAAVELEIAGALARSMEAGIVAVHVVRVPRQTSPRVAAGLTTASGDLVSKLERFAKNRKVNLHSLVAVGHSVSQVMREVAEQQEVKLILLGWRGVLSRSRIRGSIADALLRKSPAHVLVVRDKGLPERVEKITLALSPQNVGEFILPATVAMARGFDAALRIVTYGDPDAEPLRDWQEKVGRRCREQGLEESRLDLKISAPTDLVKALVREAEQADILVMGASRDWVDYDHLLGALPDRVAEASTKTVVIAKGTEPKIMSLARRVGFYFRRSRMRS